MGRSYINEGAVEASHEALKNAKVSERLQIPSSFQEKLQK